MTDKKHNPEKDLTRKPFHDIPPYFNREALEPLRPIPPSIHNRVAVRRFDLPEMKHQWHIHIEIPEVDLTEEILRNIKAILEEETDE